jgi:predicted nucleic acid-binding protein
MNSKILGYRDLGFTSFKPASVYADACFLLAFLDHDDDAGEMVEATLAQWQNNGIEYLGISNHVMSKVIQYLYTGHMINVIYTAYKKYVLNQTLSTEESDVIGDGQAAMRLMNIAGIPKLHRIERGEIMLGAYNIKEAIKIYKARFRDRKSLNHFYKEILQKYNDLFHSLEQYFGIKVVYLDSNHDASYFAQEYMREYQLEITDAVHLAIAKVHKIDYFFTLDSDYVHTLYPEDSEPIIFHLAKHAI